MTWARLEDRFPWHRKVRTLSDAAFRLHVSGICWSTEQLTNGQITHEELPHVSDIKRPRVAAAELVRSGAWDLLDGVGWMIHDYLIYNPSSEQVKQDRAAAAERQRRAREAARLRRLGESGHGVTAPVTHAVTSPEVTPAVTVPPTRPVPGTSNEVPPAPLVTKIGNRLLDAHAEAVSGVLPRKVRGQIGREIDALLAEGVHPDHVWAGLGLLRERPNLGPTLLPNLVQEATSPRPLRATGTTGRPVVDRSRPDEPWNA